jgi:hypothetical protein
MIVKNIVAVEPALASGSPAEPPTGLNSDVLTTVVDLSVMWLRCLVTGPTASVSTDQTTTIYGMS